MRCMKGIVLPSSLLICPVIVSQGRGMRGPVNAAVDSESGGNRSRPRFKSS
jgi:hypothetical protein